MRKMNILAALSIFAAVGLVFVAAVALGPHQALAQSAAGVQITPAVIEDRADPGETYSFNLRITNIADVERTFFLVTQDIIGLNDQGLPEFSTEEEITEYELSSWITIPQDSITLAAGESTRIPFSIQVPANASPGAHFGGVFLDLRPPRLRTSGAGIGFRVGTIINLRISGEVSESARLREFSTEKFIHSDPIVTFDARVENLGNVLLRPHGLIEITDMFGREIATLDVNESGAGVFPLAEKDFSILWEYDKFAFGRYQAILSLAFGEDSRKTITGATSFWVLPVKFIGTVLGILFAVIFITYFFIRMHIRKKLREMGVGRGQQAQMRLHEQQYHRSSSRLLVMVIAISVLVVVFLIGLFLLFA